MTHGSRRGAVRSQGLRPHALLASTGRVALADSIGELSVAGRRVGHISERALECLRRDATGFVFQAFQLMDDLTAQQSLELAAFVPVLRSILVFRSVRRAAAQFN